MITRKRNQAYNQTDPKPLCLSLDKPEMYFESLSLVKRKIFNAALTLSNSYWDNLYPRQSTVAKMAGCSREFVCTTFKEFEEVGLMVSDYRHMTSKRYKISSW